MRVSPLLACMTCCALAAGAAAQPYPNRAVRVIVPSTPGGSVDTIARTLGPRISERWGQQLVVENRPGAGGAIAGDLVAKSAPDGYTLLLGTIAALATNVSLQKRLPYDPLKDFAPVTLVATQNLMLVVHPSVPAKTVRELVRFAKAQPGKLSFASAGNGSGSHLSGELFRQVTGIDILHVPYKGVQPAMVDVVSGQVAMNFPSILSALPHVRSGRVRALAVTGARRTRAAPELPTMQESGVKGYESMTWYAVVAPAATPQDVVTKIGSEVAGIVKQAEVADRLSKDGADPVGSTPEEFRRYLESEIGKWRRVIRAAGIQPS